MRTSSGKEPRLLRDSGYPLVPSGPGSRPGSYQCLVLATGGIWGDVTAGRRGGSGSLVHRFVGVPPAGGFRGPRPHRVDGGVLELQRLQCRRQVPVELPQEDVDTCVDPALAAPAHVPPRP